MSKAVTIYISNAIAHPAGFCPSQLPGAALHAGPFLIPAPLPVLCLRCILPMQACRLWLRRSHCAQPLESLDRKHRPSPAAREGPAAWAARWPCSPGCRLQRRPRDPAPRWLVGCFPEGNFFHCSLNEAKRAQILSMSLERVLQRTQLQGALQAPLSARQATPSAWQCPRGSAALQHDGSCTNPCQCTSWSMRLCTVIARECEWHACQAWPEARRSRDAHHLLVGRVQDRPWPGLSQQQRIPAPGLHHATTSL